MNLFILGLNYKNFASGNLQLVLQSCDNIIGVQTVHSLAAIVPKLQIPGLVPSTIFRLFLCRELSNAAEEAYILFNIFYAFSREI